MYPSPIKSDRNGDLIIHVLGVAMALIGSVYLILGAVKYLETPLILSCMIYASFAVLSFVFSACYHQLPHHHWRAMLRRLDHAAIPAFQAATFTPLLMLSATKLSYLILGAMWILALLSIIIKLSGKLLDSRWSMAPNFLIGFVALIALVDFAAMMPKSVFLLIFAGFLFYAVGTIFYKRKTMPYRNAIWHGFVLLGSSAFFAAIWLTLFNPDQRSIAVGPFAPPIHQSHNIHAIL